MPHAARPLPHGLRGPVAVALARSAESIPAEGALPGGCQYEMKFDGYRAVIVRTISGARIWSRQGVDLSSAFPDIVAAGEWYLKPGSVIDGELCIWDGGRLSFELLQRRMARRHGPAIHVAAKEHPATFVAFDLLADGGDDMRQQPLRSRRARLERISAKWSPPMELSPATADAAEAQAWFEDYRPSGIEGIVAKASASRYAPGSRESWVKVKNRQTREVIVGAVTGPLHKPSSLVAGLISGNRLIIAGRSTRLTAYQSGQLAEVLIASADAHPWPEEIGSGTFGQRQKVRITRIEPILVVEVAADTAFDGGRFRHPLRFVRIRADLAPTDVAAVG